MVVEEVVVVSARGGGAVVLVWKLNAWVTRTRET
jgi:hypothetical protein